YDEAERNLAEHRALVERVRVVEAQLPVEAHPAFFQLVRFPVEAVANVHELHAAAGRNQLYATQGRASANRHAGAAERFFARDAELTRAYHTLLDGKWNHMMSQTHLGYTFWNHPPVNKMPAVTRVQPREEPELGFFLEGGDSPGVSTQGVGRFETRLPVFDPVNDQRHFIEVFNYSTSPLIYRLEAQDPWIRLSTTGGSLADEEARIAVHVDWASAPATATTGTVLLQGPQREHVIEVPIRPELPAVAGHVEDNGVVAIEADAFTRAVAGTEADWLVVPNLGRVGSAVTTQPFLVEPQEPGAGAPMLEYTFTVFQPGEVTLEMHLSPTLNFQKDEGLRFAVAMNDEAPTVVNLHEGETVPDWQYPLWWNTSVTDRIKVKTTTHRLTAAGPHTLRVWMIDPGVVFQKFVLDAGGLQPSYLGPPAKAPTEGSNQ
ncbi:MAG: glycosyl hydrolase, partial [Opitutales bacterium]